MKLTDAEAPHIHDPADSEWLMGQVLLALLPALGVGVWRFGWPALAVIFGCTCAAIGAAWLVHGRWPGSSPAVSGLLLAMSLPPTVPIWLAVSGGVFAVVVGRELCGGEGQNLFNPAMLTRAAMVLFFPGTMTIYGGADTFTQATPLHRMALSSLPQESIGELLIGKCGGSIGEVSAAALLLGGGYLLLRRVIDAAIPLTFLAGAVVSVALIPHSAPTVAWILSQLCSGGLMLGAFFMATDYTTAPVTLRGRLIYGTLCGVLTGYFRGVSLFPEGVTYAILLMNAFSRLVEGCTQPRRFGRQRGAAK